MKRSSKSSEDYKGGETDFLAAWKELGKRLRREPRGNLNEREWKRLDQQMEQQNYPAIHHSKKYEEFIHPAYRILTGASERLITDKLKND